MAGVPLAGKTTVARRLVDRLGTQVLHVENDRLRPDVAERLGHEEPVFDGDENLATYEAARHLVERGLDEGLHVVHDATNLDEAARQPTYEIGEALDAPARVLFVQAPSSVRQARAERAGPGARRAHEALGGRQPQPDACSRPHLVLDGTRDPDALVDELLADGRFASLVEP